DKLYAEYGDVITYTVVIENKGNIDSSINSIFKDTIPYFTTFVNNSSKVNGVTTIESPETGINIGIIEASSIKTIEFSVKVNSIK
ncbi:MAG: hypothetical protein ACRC28_13000, partial [Clostridium sp.]|uniref:hypothetical protein n=1 Tax=Clostridium sp. TaxID=1506 RepID=UPI003F3946A0